MDWVLSVVVDEKNQPFSSSSSLVTEFIVVMESGIALNQSKQYEHVWIVNARQPWNRGCGTSSHSMNIPSHVSSVLKKTQNEFGFTQTVSNIIQLLGSSNSKNYNRSDWSGEREEILCKAFLEAWDCYWKRQDQKQTMTRLYTRYNTSSASGQEQEPDVEQNIIRKPNNIVAGDGICLSRDLFASPHALDALVSFWLPLLDGILSFLLVLFG